MANQELEKQVIRDRLLGWGVVLDPVFAGISGDIGRDLVFGATAGGRDFKTVRAMDNLAQDLEVAFTTLLGSDMFNTSFGFDGLNALVDETDPILMRERVRIGVIKTLRQEPRIRRIVDVKLADGRLGTQEVKRLPNGDIDPNSEGYSLRRSRTLKVDVAFETISGDQAAVELGEVPL